MFEPFGEDVYALDYLNSHVVASGDLDRNGWVDFVVHNVGNHKARIWMNGGFRQRPFQRHHRASRHRVQP